MARARLTVDDLASDARQEMHEIERRRRVYLAGLPSVALEGRTLIVVDDGIATGASMRAALTALRPKNPARLVLAVPVAQQESLDGLASLADDIVCLAVPADFQAVGFHYLDFHQLRDEEVVRLLQDARRERR